MIAFVTCYRSSNLIANTLFLLLQVRSLFVILSPNRVYVLTPQAEASQRIDVLGWITEMPDDAAISEAAIP